MNKSMHTSVSMREVGDRSMVNLHGMATKERMAEFVQIVLYPIMHDDMPNFLTVGLNENGPSDNTLEFEIALENPVDIPFQSYIRIRWDSTCFTAVTNIRSVQEIVYVQMAILHNNYKVTLNESGELQLQIYGVNTRDDLRYLALVMRNMASVAFRDAWLLHLIRGEPSWVMQYDSPPTFHEDGILNILRLRLWNRYEQSLIVSLIVKTPEGGSDGYVLVVPDFVEGYSLEEWNRRSVGLVGRRDSGMVIIQLYKTSANVADVIGALKALLG